MRAILACMALTGVLRWRSNTDTFKIERGGVYRFVAVGSPDIFAVLQPTRQLIEIEVQDTVGRLNANRIADRSEAVGRDTWSPGHSTTSRRFLAGAKNASREQRKICKPLILVVPGAESNHRHADFQFWKPHHGKSRPIPEKPNPLILLRAVRPLRPAAAFPNPTCWYHCGTMAIGLPVRLDRYVCG